MGLWSPRIQRDMGHHTWVEGCDVTHRYRAMKAGVMISHMGTGAMMSHMGTTL